MKKQIQKFFENLQKRLSLALIFVFALAIGLSSGINYLSADNPEHVYVNASIKIAPPTNVNVSCQNKEGTIVTWNASPHAPLGIIDGYTVYYKRSSELLYTRNQTLYDDTLLKAIIPDADITVGERWDFKVYAFNSSGEESNDNCSSCETENILIKKCDFEPIILNDENDILTYTFPEAAGDAIIDSMNHTVDIEVVTGTDPSDLIAKFTVSEGATAFIGNIVQISEVSNNNFTNSIVYRVVSESGIPQDWIINVTVKEYPLTTIKAWPEKRIPKTGNWDTKATLEIRKAGTITPLYVTKFETRESDGIYENLDLISHVTPEEYYDVTLKGFSHLRFKKENLLFDENFDYLDFTNGETDVLLAGDTDGTDGNNFVNALDISKIVDTMYTINERTDLNQEGIVNALDIAITIDNMYKWGDT